MDISADDLAIVEWLTYQTQPVTLQDANDCACPFRKPAEVQQCIDNCEKAELLTQTSEGIGVTQQGRKLIDFFENYQPWLNDDS